MKKLKILTFNAAIQDISLFGYPLYRPLPHVRERLLTLCLTLEKLDADIVFLQELFHLKYQKLFFNSLKHRYPYAAGFANSKFGLRLGNELLIISKFSISTGKLIRFTHAAPEELRHTSKGFFHVTLTLPQLGRINLVNFHATAGGAKAHPESGTMEDIRSKQIDQLLGYIQPLENILLTGDLNAGPHSSIKNYKQVINDEFIDAFSATGEDGITWDPLNPLVQLGAEAHLPAQRIDHVFVDQSLMKKITPLDASIVLDEKYLQSSSGRIPLSDHYGVFATMEIS